MKKSLSLLILALLTSHFIQAQKDTIWYDNNWEIVSKKEASFYRPDPKPKENGFWITDYYISGKKQAEGFSTSKKEDLFEGLFTWYNENGTISQTANYINGVLNGELITYLNNGEVYKSIFNHNEFYDGTYANEDKGAVFIMKMDQGNYLSQKIYSTENSKLGYEIIYKDNIISKQISYNEKGDKIGEVVYNECYSIQEGTLANYSFNPFRIYSTITYENSSPVKTIFYYKNGKLKAEEIEKDKETITTYYTISGEKIGQFTINTTDNDEYFSSRNGIEVTFNYEDGKEDLIFNTTEYKDGKTLKSTFFNDNGILKKVTTYNESGNPILDENYDSKGTITSTLTYDTETGSPLTGTSIVDNTTSIYKDGNKISETVLYKNGTVFKKRENDTITFYDKKGKVLSTVTLFDKYDYKVNDPYNGTIYELYEDRITNSYRYKNGELSEQITYNENNKDRLVPLKSEQYDTYGNLTAKIRYFKNGNKRSKIEYKDYSPLIGTYYDMKGNILSTYNFTEQDGTEYTYFDDAPYYNINENVELLPSIKTYKKGILVYEKTYTTKLNDNQTAFVYKLQKEIDYFKQGTFYDGDTIYVTKYQNGNPYEGTVITDGEYNIGEDRIIENYKQGLKDGLQLYYSYNNSIRKENYILGKREGYTEIYRDSILIAKIPYQNDAINGTVIYYDANGNEEASLTYNNDEILYGTKIESNYYGNVSKITYKDKKRIEILNYKNDILNMKQTVEKDSVYVTTHYYENEKVKFRFNVINTGEYSENLLDGKVIHYSEKGDKIYEAHVQNGKLTDGTLWLKPSYYLSSEADYYKIIKKKKECIVQGIVTPNTINFEIKETILNNKKSEDILNEIFKTSSLTPNNLYGYGDEDTYY